MARDVVLTGCDGSAWQLTGVDAGEVVLNTDASGLYDNGSED